MFAFRENNTFSSFFANKIDICIIKWSRLDFRAFTKQCCSRTKLTISFRLDLSFHKKLRKTVSIGQIINILAYFFFLLKYNFPFNFILLKLINSNSLIIFLIIFWFYSISSLTIRSPRCFIT